MKQVSNTIKCFVPSSPLHHSISNLRVICKYRFVILLAGFALLITSCQKEDQRNKCVPFKGNFAISHTKTGVAGTGEASQIRRFTLVSDFQGNTSIFTAENGDQIFTTFTELADPQPDNMAKVHLDNTITGGTGRFKGATGSFGMDALVNESLGTGAGTLEGTICY
jgi:hypothetical protein